MHKKVQGLVLAGIISANTLSPTVEVFANEISKSVGYSNTNTSEVSKKQIYLSDIDYEDSSSVGWGEIRKDSNVEGNGAIKLIIEGETVEFGKGMGAHANSTLIYNVSDYSDIYTRLTTYLGVDASRGSNGNGVIFTISTSEDGQTWKEIKKTDVLKGDMESVYVDIDLQGANFIKLHANNNRDASADHAVYADLKLVKSDYTQSSNDIAGLNSASHYDGILSSNSISENISQNKDLILKRAFVNRFGYQTLKRMADQDEMYANGINYLVNNTRALEYFIMGGPVNMHGSYQRSLKSFCEIYDKYKDIMNDEDDNYFNLRLAISVALSYSRTETVGSWMKSQKGVNPVHRYEVYQYLVTSGKMDEGGGKTNDHKQWSSAEFKALPIPMMRWSVDARMNDDEILWLVDYALSEKEKGRNYFDAYNYIVYTMGHNFDNPEYYKEENREKYNEKYKFENYFSDYGTPNQQRMWMAFEEGTVCGGLAQTYSVLADVFGRPSSPCGQPGHAASATYEWNRANQRYEWVLQNDISGWAESGNQFDDRMLGWGDDWKNSWSIWTNASYTVLAGDASLKWEDYTKANLLVLLADSYNDNNSKIECYKKALEHQKINLDAWERIVECYRNDDSKTSEQSLELAKGIIEAYTYYPQAMVELLNYIAPKITDESHIAQLDILKTNALVSAKQATPEQSTCVNMSKQMANWYLKDNANSELATFSFDGENAGKIVLNSKYDGSQIRVRYSLDGGNEWKQTNEHVITLTPEELASITAENDIKVGLVGTDAIYTIDILAGNTISTNTIQANDNENLLLGAVDNLEFSLDGGTTWCNYVTTTGEETINPNGVTGLRIEGNQTVKVRYKAYGVHLQSPEVEYTFTENQDTDDRKYVQLKNINVASSSAHHGGREAKNFIDGKTNTSWHTPFGTTTNDKFYTVELDKVRRITSLEYLPEGRNGRLQSGKILTSIDGETWTEAKVFTNLADNTDTKVLNLDQPTDCKYIKLVATETYGNSNGERNMYFSGKMLNLYEVIVNHDDEITTLPDDVPVEEVTPETPEPPVEEDTTPDPQPPVEDEEEEVTPETPQPPVEDEEEEVTPETPQPPVGDEEEEVTPETPQPPVGDEEGEVTPETPQPPVEDEEEEVTPEPQPPVEDVVPPTPQPPTEEEEEDTEVETPEFTHEVLELVGGDGQEYNPYEFIVKSVEIDKFQSFLDELKEWTLNFISVSTDGEYTSYNMRLDKKSRNVGDTIFITLKVKNSQTEILDVLNELGKELQPPTETEPDKFEEVLDGTSNDDMMVTPETETPSVDSGVTPDDDNNTGNNNNGGSNNNNLADNTNNSNSNANNNNNTTNNPQTGDIGIAGYVGLGLASVLGLFKNRRKRK